MKKKPLPGNRRQSDHLSNGAANGVIPPDSSKYVKIYKHRHDDFLWFVLRSNGGDDYSTHLYNGQFPALAQGHYNLTKEQAEQDFADRCARY